MAKKIKGSVRFDIEALRELAGGKVFARGEEYFHDGSVQILSLSPKRVLAQVAGTEDYRTVLTGRGTDIDGECSCPAFEDWGFCKHMVATALAANAVGDGVEAEASGALPRIRDHLKSKGVDVLVDMILELAERDTELFRKLEMASAVTSADDKTLEARLRKAIDAATRTAAYVDYRAAAGWRAGVDEALDAVADLAASGRANIALKLVQRAIERIEAAFESIDDSDGHLRELLERAAEIHLASVRAVRPEPIALARDLFKRETDKDFETFAGAAELYADVLGEEGLAEYRRLAAAAWDKLPSRSGKARADDVGSYHQIKDILDFFAERDGDVDARIALRAKDLSSQWNYLQLAEFCLSQGRKEDALRHAEECLWLFEDDRPDERLLLFAIERLCKAHRKADAEAHVWRVFQKAPSLELYRQLRKLGGDAAGERARAFLEARLVDKPRTAWENPADLLVNILLHDKRFDPAWALVRKHGASPHVKRTLAAASDATHPREALEVYAAQVEQFVRTGGNPAYAEATKLIARMAALRSPTEHATFVADLKARHGRKRNFMNLLG